MTVLIMMYNYSW